MEITGSVNNTALCELFERRRNIKTQEELNTLMNEIAEEIVMNAKFLTPVRLSTVPKLNNDGTGTIDPDTKISFALISSPEGKKYYPAFTSVDEVLKWDSMKEQKPLTLALGFDDYSDMIVSKHGAEGLVINPFSDNLILDKQLIAAWREKKQYRTEGHAEHVITADSNVKTGAPDPFNMELSVALSTAARNDPAIKALWFRGMIHNGEKSYLAVIDYSGDRKKVFSAVGEAAKPYLSDMALNIIALDEAIGKAATENVMPIYKA